LRMRAQRRALADGRRLPDGARGRSGRGALGGLRTERPGEPGGRGGDGGGRHRHLAQRAEDPHRRRGEGIGCRGHDGVRRRVSDLPRQALRGLGARRPRRPCPRSRAPHPRRDPTPRRTAHLGTRAAMTVALRGMRAEDWPEVERIYAEGIATGHATFEAAPPEREAFLSTRVPGLSWVAVSGAGLVGWAAASRVSAREVYRGVVEHSVYV